MNYQWEMLEIREGRGIINLSVRCLQKRLIGPSGQIMKGAILIMGFVEVLKKRAKENIKTIVLPETEDMRTLEATDKILKEALPRSS